MEATKSLDCDNFSFPDTRCCSVERMRIFRYDRELGSALRTGDWLCMESAIDVVFILGAAIPANLEMLHRRSLSIIGNSLYNREARAAIGAVSKRIARPPPRLADLIDAVGANGCIRWTGCLRSTVLRHQYLKLIRRGWIDFHDLNGVYFGQRRGRVTYRVHKQIHGLS